MIKLYSESKEYKLYNGNMLDILDVIEENSIDAIITDPPYELGFMGKSWDKSGIAFQKETWEKCLKVLKPGGYLLAFGGSRTFARIDVAIEDAGFEIRDTIMWLYGSGFPKGMNIGLAIDKRNGVESKIVGYADNTMLDFRDIGEKQKEISGINKLTFGQIEKGERKEQPIYEAQNEWNGWNTQLKPAYEPIIVAQKPVEKSIIENVMKWGVGGINIDECRVGNDEILSHNAPKGTFAGGELNRGSDTSNYFQHNGRYPSNVIHDGSEEVIKDMPNSNSGSEMTFGSVRKKQDDNLYKLGFTQREKNDGQHAPDNYGDGGSVARYFYCAKASKFDRDEGLNEFKEQYVLKENVDEEIVNQIKALLNL